MKVLILSKYYRNYLRNFFDNHPVSKDSTYDELYRAIIEDRYFWSDYFKQELPLYGYQVEQLIVDAKPLQIKWAGEFGKISSEKDWYFEIIFQQMKFYRPEILFIQDWSNELGSEFIIKAKKSCPSIKIVIGYCGEGHPGPKYFAEHDIVLSCASDNVELFKKNGLAAYHIYHAFHPCILKQLGPAPEKNDKVAFVGRVVPKSIHHRQRAIFLFKLYEAVPFKIHGQIRRNENFYEYHPIVRKIYSNLNWLLPLLKDSLLAQKSKFTESLENFHEERKLQEILNNLSKILEHQCFGISMFNLLRSYAMLVNFHISPNVAANLRLFEVTGVGSCLVTDWKKNLADLFDPDYEVVTYKSVEEAADKIQYLKNNPSKIEEIAKAGQRRTLSTHTYKQRAYDLHMIIKSHM